MNVQHFFDPVTHTLTYVVFDPSSRDAVIVDPVLDYDAAGVLTSTASAEKLVEFCAEHELLVQMILETHAHADHFTSAPFLKNKWPKAQVVIGSGITEVQRTFKDILQLGEDFKSDGSQFDRLVEDEEVVKAGSLSFEVIHTPGHTPACCSYLFEGEFLFTGDALFMPDSGVGRADFPGGSAEDLYKSVVTRLYCLPEHIKTYTGHDYQPKGRELRFQSTIGEQKAANVHLPASQTEAEFVGFRRQRDAGLKAPSLLYPSIQVNINAGRLPDPASNGIRYLKLPMDAFGM